MRQADVALALISRVVDRHESLLPRRRRPQPREPTIPRPVAVPRRRAFEQPPLAVAHGRVTQHRQQPFIETLHLVIDWFDRRADEVRRDACSAPLELTIMKKTQTGRQIRDDGGSLVHLRWEGGSGPRLVVVLHKACEPVLIVEAGEQMLSRTPGVAVAETIVEALVVRVVEALLVHGRFEVPIDFGHEAESWNPFANARRRLGPEERSTTTPGALEDIGEDEHGHVTPHPVALFGNSEQLAPHRLL